jgi:hypothetical protein
VLLLLTALLIASGSANAEPNKTVTDYLHGQIAQCWNIPRDTVGIGAVTIAFKLDRRGRIVGTPALGGHEADIGIELDDKGELASPPRIIAIQPDIKRTTFVQSAITAIQECSPFPALIKLAPYNSWKQVMVTFKPPQPR